MIDNQLVQSTVDYVVSKAKIRNESEQSNTLLLKSKDESVMDSLAEVGIFWLSLTNKVIKYSLPVGDVKLDHDIRDVPISHFSYWESLNKNTSQYSNLEYTDLRRGRVVYNEKLKKFVIITKKSIVNNQSLKTIILQSFHLKPGLVVWSTDPHYE